MNGSIFIVVLALAACIAVGAWVAADSRRERLAEYTEWGALVRVRSHRAKGRR